MIALIMFMILILKIRQQLHILLLLFHIIIQKQRQFPFIDKNLLFHKFDKSLLIFDWITHADFLAVFVS